MEAIHSLPTGISELARATVGSALVAACDAGCGSWQRDSMGRKKSAGLDGEGCTMGVGQRTEVVGAAQDRIRGDQEHQQGGSAVGKDRSVPCVHPIDSYMQLDDSTPSSQILCLFITRPHSKVEHKDTGRMLQQDAFLPDCSGGPRLNPSSPCSSPVFGVRLSPRPS